MTIFALPDRGVLRLSGEETLPFLQNLVSNDVSVATPDQAVYACLLTPQGKFLHDFFVFRDPEDTGALLLEMNAGRLPDLKKRLTMYRLRAKVVLDDVSNAYTSVATIIDGDRPAGLWSTDPRNAGMGWRGLIPADADVAAVADPAEYEAHRIALGIPDGIQDMEAEKNFLLEFRMDDLNAIDFSKGCYVGQELTARTKYRGNVKRQHFIAGFDGSVPPHGTPVLNEDGVAVGTVLSGSAANALALVRLDQIDKPLEAGTGPITLTKPDFAIE